MMRSIGIKKGNVPAAICRIEYLGRTPWIVKRFKPNGGVTKPISARITYTTPHHIGSKPRFDMAGMTKGKVNNIIDRESKNIPKIRYMMQIIKTVPYFPTGRSNINDENVSVSPEA